MTSPARRQWLIVSNRLPFKLDAEGRLSPGSGGLVTAIRGIDFDACPFPDGQPADTAVWLGAAPDGVSREAFDEGVAELGLEQGGLRYAPVFIEPALYDAYYNGMCNDVLWPLLHYEAQELSFDREAWRAYETVNELFAEAILEIATPDDVVWIHDYHLFLLPRLLRARAPGLRIGFFLHVPFPSSEIFRQLPVRETVIESLLEANLVGFHDYDYLRHFCSAAAGLLGATSNLVSCRRDGHDHVTELGVFPVSIDTHRFRSDALASDAVEAHYRKLAEQQHCKKLVLGVDRLDYMKGILLKLAAFEHFLEHHAEERERVRLLQIAVPSRTEVAEYVRLRESIERRVSEINGRYGSPNFMPVHYIFSSVPYEELLALYRLADVLLVTSKRDGMNLVAQEYIACQPASDPGVLVLSEFAGSSSVLSHALRINPWDVEQTSRQLERALQATRAERIAWHAPMLRYLQNYTASTWANSFVQSLSNSVPATERDTEPRALALEEHEDALLARAAAARRLLLLVDFDGTLVPIQAQPELAVLSSSDAARLRAIAEHEAVELVVVSGRDRAFLCAQLGAMPVGLACEHGALYSPPAHGEPRHEENLVRSDPDSWRPLVQRIMQDFCALTPDSRLEPKNYALAWHYRNSPRAFADHQAQKLVLELTYALGNLPANVIHGDKVVEVRPIEASKGLFLSWFLEQRADTLLDTLIVALGDDRTDEELFAALPPEAIAIKVGTARTCAGYRLARQSGVLPLLERLAAAIGDAAPRASASAAARANPPGGTALGAGGGHGDGREAGAAPTVYPASPSSPAARPD